MPDLCLPVYLFICTFDMLICINGAELRQDPTHLSAPVNYDKSEAPGSSHPGLCTLIGFEVCPSISFWSVRETVMVGPSCLPDACNMNWAELQLIMIVDTVRCATEIRFWLCWCSWPFVSRCMYNIVLRTVLQTDSIMTSQHFSMSVPTVSNTWRTNWTKARQQQGTSFFPTFTVVDIVCNIVSKKSSLQSSERDRKPTGSKLCSQWDWRNTKTQNFNWSCVKCTKSQLEVKYFNCDYS